MDTDFRIDELNGFPRAFVNFLLDTIGINGIFKLMENKENRECAFYECLAYHDGKEIFKSRSGRFSVKLKTNKKKFRQKVKSMKVWLYQNREVKVSDLMEQVRIKLLGIIATMEFHTMVE